MLKDITELADRLLSELAFVASRSSGAGGQHVNKVNTRVELRFCISESEVLSAEEKEILLEKLSNRLTKEKCLIITSEKTRSQNKNRKDCIDKFRTLIIQSLTPPKKRISTKPSFRSRMKRKENKMRHSQKKADRKRPDF
ncbi:MAG: alternative ribosome rescue aminoacyl-tRNA hydrolase ArfB [Bacteroidota bacterium]